MDYIRNLNEIHIDDDLGIHNESFIIPDHHNLLHSYLTSVRYIIEDLNTILNKDINRFNYILGVVYTAQLQEAVNMIKNCYRQDILSDFKFDIKASDKFIKALRSFIFAHPLKTSRHSEYGLNGNLKCIDIRPSLQFLINAKNKLFYFDKDGIKQYTNEDVDVWAYVYNMDETESIYNTYIGLNFNTVRDIANNYIDYLYSLDDYLSNISKTINYKEISK